MADAHENLTRHRRTLIEVTNALHKSREPWGLSIYETQSRLMALSDSVTSMVRLRGDALARLSGDSLRNARADLESFIGLDELTLSPQSSPWVTAFVDATITPPEAASKVLDVLTTLNTDTLVSAFETFSRSADGYGPSRPNGVAAWGAILQLFRDTKITLDLFEKEIFELPLAQITSKLAPGEANGIASSIAKITNSSYRQARRQALSFWIGSRPSPNELFVAVKKARDLSEAWRQSAKGGVFQKFRLIYWTSRKSISDSVSN
ncbi:hypothetical protein [Acidithrix sp. C25]|uniref:hypothetical protein n=1 Tax=Acidithrix sp. C25 TaxID=1671482 RepID=UPI00191BCA3B|nr:hypothetical protein [Acidithrix sp. C25]CAG4902022.1 unnamed protein product [Acidithrix sp. C25]